MERRDRRVEAIADADLAETDEDFDLDALRDDSQPAAPAPPAAASDDGFGDATPEEWDTAGGFTTPPVVVTERARPLPERTVAPGTPRELWPVAKLAPGRLHEVALAHDVLDVETGEVVTPEGATDAGLVAWALAADALAALAKTMRDAARGELLARIDRTGGAVATTYGTAKATRTLAKPSAADARMIRAELERLVADGLVPDAVLANVAPLVPNVTAAKVRDWIDANADALPEDRRAAIVAFRPASTGRNLAVDPLARPADA